MVVVCGGSLVICCLILFINVKQNMMSPVTLPAQLLRASVLIVNICMQLKQRFNCLAQLRRCLGCILMKLSHLKILCDALHTGNCNCVATLVYVGLLTFPPVDCDERGVIADDFSDWVV